MAAGVIALLLVIACALTAPVEREKVVEIEVIAPSHWGAATGAQLVLTSQIDYLKYFNEGLVKEELWLRYHGPGMMDNIYESSIHHGIILPEAIRRAMEKVGYEDLYARAVKKALETIRTSIPMGLVPRLPKSTRRNAEGLVG